MAIEGVTYVDGLPYDADSAFQNLLVSGGFSNSGPDLSFGGGGQVGTILGPIIEEIPAVVSSVGAGMTISKALCAMFPSLCNSNNALMAQTPNAGLLTGSCPPGRVLRRIPYGRDKCIKKPRMNPLNPKALMRATRRLAGFHNFAKKAEKQIQKSFRGAGISAPRRGTSRARCGTCAKKSCGGC
jgi:hypothetical protein